MKAPHLHSKAKAYAMSFDSLKDRGVSYKAFIVGYEDRDTEVAKLKAELQQSKTDHNDLQNYINSHL